MKHRVLAAFLAVILFITAVPSAFAVTFSPEEQLDLLREVDQIIREDGLESSEEDNPLERALQKKLRGLPTDEELLKKLDNGLYLTSLQGLHAGANVQSGDFSLQADGFLVKDGVKVSPIKNFTVADNFFTLIKKVDALSDQVKFSVTSSIGSPDVLFTDVSISGK